MSPFPVQNDEVAELFRRYGALLEIDGANPFRVRAYREAAFTIQGLPRPLAAMLAEGEDLTRLPGIGKDLAGKIEEILQTGRFVALEELQARLPGEVVDLTALPGLGPKRVRTLHQMLGISDLAGLERAAREGRLRDLPGLGIRTEAKILRAIADRRAVLTRTPLFAAEQIAEPLLRYLKQVPGVRRAEIAGSFRRRRESVGDLDIVVACAGDCPVMARLADYPATAEVVAMGTTRATVILRSGLQVDLRAVPRASYGTALLYFTGSKAHTIALRSRAVVRGCKLNEYGLFKGRQRIAGRSEERVYDVLGLPYIEPELREDRGEIAAAEAGRLPKLIGLGDIRGDLHVHTRASDGHDTVRAMAEAARDLGYEYVAISDHSQHTTIAHGLDPKRLNRQIDEIDRLNDELEGFRVLRSCEVDILENGRLDLPNDVLARLDLTVCAVHYKFDLPRRLQTERLIRAMDNPCFRILAHPTGRLIGDRPPYEVDLDRVLEAARERGRFVELNAHPERLDLDDHWCRAARELGVKLAIGSDAHSTGMLANMRFGIGQARRGWLEADDVLNTRSLAGLLALLGRNRP